MLKKIISIILSLIIFSIMIISVNADATQNYTDSRFVSDNIKNQIDLKSSDNLIKMYRIDLLIAFNNYKNMNEVLDKKEHIIEEIYIATSKNKILSYYGEFSGEITKFEYMDNDYLEYCEGFISKTINYNNIVKNISSDIKVNNIYLLQDCGYLGMAVYYETNKGDYVYYPRYDDETEKRIEYILPADKFSELMKTVYDEIKKNSVSPEGYARVGSVNVNDLYDFTPFIIETNNNFVLIYVLIIFSVLFLFTISTVSILVIRKKKIK